MTVSFVRMDITMFFMAVVVVAIHTNPLANCSNQILLNIFDFISHCAVPFFFLRSGFFLGRKVNQAADTNNALAVIKKYLFRICRLYLIWTIVYFPLAIYGFYIHHTPLLKSVLLYVRGFFLIGEQYNSWILWYLLAMIYALGMIYFLYKKAFSTTQIILISVILFALGMGIDYIAHYSGANHFICQLNGFSKALGLQGRFFSSALFISTGFFLSTKKIPWIISISAFFLGLFLFMLSVFPPICIFISSVALFSLCTKGINHKTNFFFIIRKASIAIYFIHLWIWTLCYLTIYGEKTFGPAIFAVTIFFTLIISLGHALHATAPKKA